MNNSTDSPIRKSIESSAFGVVRGLFVQTLIFPFEVLKIRVQGSQDSEKSIKIAQRVFQQEGWKAFYTGLYPQLVKTSLKQIWCWPMMTTIPGVCHRYGIEGIYAQQVVTGLAIAAVDAAATTPLEKVKISSAFNGRVIYSLWGAYKEGWHGFTAHWAKRSINWVTFLTSQKYLRDRARAQSEQPITIPQVLKIGTQVALIVSLVSAPLDFVNTRVQTQKFKFSHLVSRDGFLMVCRGWHLNAVCLIIQSVASVFLFELLDRR